MSARSKRTAEPQWTPPTEAELRVLRRQIELRIADGEAITSQPWDASWAWETTLAEIIACAFGDESAWLTTFHYAGRD